MNSTTIAMRIVLFNSKANRTEKENYLLGELKDKKDIRNERQKMVLILRDNFPNANPDVLITDVEEKSYIKFDVDTIEEGIRKGTGIKND